MAMSGTTPDPPPTSRTAVSPRQTNQPRWPSHLEGVARHDLLVQEAGDSPSGRCSTVSSISPIRPGGLATE